MAKVGRMVKEAAVKELSEQLSEHPNLIVTSINRLTAVEADALRQKLHGFQARLIVVKQTLGKRTLAQLNVTGLTDLFEGSVGLVVPGEDVLPTAKTIVEFVRTHEERLAVRGALIDGVLLDRSRVEQLASLPPRPQLLAQVAATIESPIADVVFTLERLISDLIWAAEQAAEKKPLPAPMTEGQAGAPTEPTTPPPTDTKTPEIGQEPTTQEETPA